jgi:hypothetical protein
MACAAIVPPAAHPLVEKILCSNVTSDVTAHAGAEIFRHTIFGYDEQLTWPPAGWQELRCWHCCETFTTYPVPLPHEVDRRSGCFRVFGFFCSFACSKGYLLEHVHWTAGERLLLLEEMAHEVFHYNGPEIQAAPPRHRLACFGGDLSLAEFRRPQTGLHAVLAPPLISQPEVYERVLPPGEGGTETWSVKGLHPAPPRKASAPPPPAPPTTIIKYEAAAPPPPAAGDGPQSKDAANGGGLYDSYVPPKPKPPPVPPAPVSHANSTLTMFLKKR